MMAPVTSGASATRTCKICGTPLTTKKQRQYCSRACIARGQQVRLERTCPTCGEGFETTPSKLATGAGRHCSKRCADEGKRVDRSTSGTCARCGQVFAVQPSRDPVRKYCTDTCRRLAVGEAKRKPVTVVACAVCGRERTYRAGVQHGPFCSRACAGESFKKRKAVPCPTCGTLVERRPSDLKRDPHHPFGRRFCSRACYAASKRRRVEITCERCGKVVAMPRFRARGRRFCSRACAIGTGGTAEVACQQCGAVRRVVLSQIARGWKYCSRRCYFAAERDIRLTLGCQQCRKRFTVPRCEGDRKYCSRRCFLLAWAPRRFKCRACGQAFESRKWRRQRFCSRSCANHGRQRAPRPNDVSRNDLILELHGQGMKAPVIAKALEARDVGWSLSPVGIRTVISRARPVVGR